MSPIRTMLIVGCLLIGAGCGSPGRPVLTQAFPPPPVDLKAPLPKLQALPAKPTLRDILGADLANFQVSADLRAEDEAWRNWWAAQDAAWRKP